MDEMAIEGTVTSVHRSGGFVYVTVALDDPRDPAPVIGERVTILGREHEIEMESGRPCGMTRRESSGGVDLPIGPGRSGDRPSIRHSGRPDGGMDDMAIGLAGMAGSIIGAMAVWLWARRRIRYWRRRWAEAQTALDLAYDPDCEIYYHEDDFEDWELEECDEDRFYPTDMGWEAAAEADDDLFADW